MTFGSRHFAFAYELVHTIDKHVGFGNVFEITAPVARHIGVTGIDGVGLVRYDLGAHCAYISVIRVAVAKQHIVEVHVFLTVAQQLIDGFALRDGSITVC